MSIGVSIGASIGRGTAWMLAGQIAVSASNWLQFAIVARTSTMAATGRFALAVAIATPLALAAAMNLRVVQVCDVKNRFAFQDYVSFRLVTTAASIGVAPVVVLLFFESSLLAPVLALTAVRGVEAISDVIHGRLQIAERWGRIAVSMLARGGLGLAAFGVSTVLTRDSTWGLVALLGACLAVLLAIDLPFLRQEGELSDRPRPPPMARTRSVGRLAATALPLALASVLASLADALPKYVLEHSRGPEAVALFTAPLQIVLIGAVVVNTYAQASTRHLATAYAEGRPGRFRVLVAKLTIPAILTGALLVLLAAAFGRATLTRVFGAAYADGGVFLVAAVGGTLSYVSSIVAGSVVAAGRLRQGLYGNLLALLVVAVTGWALIPTRGAAGAAWTFVVASAALSAFPALAAFGLRAPRGSGGATSTNPGMPV